MEDKKIIELYWDRDESAIVETQKKYGNYCYSIAKGILRQREDAEEVTNDTYAGAWNCIPPHRPEILRTFLGKITRHYSAGSRHGIKYVGLRQQGKCFRNRGKQCGSTGG